MSEIPQESLDQTQNKGTEESKPIQLPDDHPMVTALATLKRENRELKASKVRLDELEAAQKTAEEKAADREKAAIARAEQAEARALRREVALDPAGDGSLPSLSTADAALLDDLTDEDAMRRLASRLANAAAAEQQPRTPKPNPAQRKGESKPDDADATARAFFGLT